MMSAAGAVKVSESSSFANPLIVCLSRVCAQYDNSCICGSLVSVLHISPVADYPLAGRGPSRYRLVLLDLHGALVYLVLFDDQVGQCDSFILLFTVDPLILNACQVRLSDLFNVSDTLFVFRPWISSNADDPGVFGGQVDCSARPLGYVVEMPHSKLLRTEEVGAAAGPSGVHLCVGGVTAILKISPDGSRPLDSGGPSSVAAPHLFSSDESLGDWASLGQVLSVVRIHSRCGAGNLGFNEVLIIFKAQRTPRLPASSSCSCGGSGAASLPQVVLLLCCERDLPAAGKALKAGQTALFSGMVTQLVTRQTADSPSEGGDYEGMCSMSVSGVLCVIAVWLRYSSCLGLLFSC